MKFLSLSAALLPFSAIAADGPAFPPPAKSGEGALLSSGLIYPLDGRQTPQCHASTITETPTGLVAAWFGGTAEKNPDVGIWLSHLRDGSWTRPVEIVDGSEGEEKEFPCWNPVLFQPSSKGAPLMLFYKVGPSPASWWGMVVTSADGGSTWSDPRRLGDNPAIGHLLGPVKNKPVELPGGTIICPSSSEHDGWRVHFEITRDLGKSWEVVGPINDGKTFGSIQPSILTHPGGKLQILCRSQQNVITQSSSDDGGKSWGPMTSSTLPNPNSGTDAVTLRDGRHLLVYNHTTRSSNPGGRSMLNVAISADGTSWKPALTLELAKGEFSYPAVIQSSDGNVHVTYTFQRQSVKHAVLDPAKL